MDWKYKHFAGVQIYTQSASEVSAAARGYMAEALGWTIIDTADGGFEARGYSFSHAGIATFHASPEGAGARLTVELAMERAGPLGFMLFDVGGYYNGQIARWLLEIGDRLAGRVGELAPHRPPSSGERLLSWLIMFAFVGFLIWAAWALVLGPIIGLTTGVLDLPGRNSDLVLTGAWARGVSAGILALDVVLVFLVLRRRRPRPRMVH
jgi:hypothetical protein